MAEITGAGGSVTFATGYAANVHEWAITLEADIHEKTDFTDGASGWKAFLAGLKGWSGTYSAYLDDTTPIVAPGAAAATATFTIVSGQTLSGNIIVKSLESVVPVGDMTKVTVSFQGDGALSIG